MQIIRLIHIRDQKEQHGDIPEHIFNHPVFQLTTNCRVHIQLMSASISKASSLVGNEKGMQIFRQLANALPKRRCVAMVYLVVCILEHVFGKDAIDDIEAINRNLEIPDIPDDISSDGRYEHHIDDGMHNEMRSEKTRNSRK